MLKCEIGETVGLQIEADGNIAAIINDVLNLIQAVHHHYLEENLLEGAVFRTALTEAVLNDGLWVPADKEGR